MFRKMYLYLEKKFPAERGEDPGIPFPLFVPQDVTVSHTRKYVQQTCNLLQHTFSHDMPSSTSAHKLRSSFPLRFLRASINAEGRGYGDL